MIKITKVTGASLSPLFLPGDYVVALTCHWLAGRISAGDVIIFRHPEHGQMIKKVAAVNREKDIIEVQGTHPASIDSSHFGPIPPETVIGRVIWHIQQQNGSSKKNSR